MAKSGKMAMTLGLLVLLSGCNTTDALVPRVDIGSSTTGFSSSPVTQSQTAQMAGAAQQQPFTSPPQAGGYHPAYDQGAVPAQPTYQAGTGAPPTSLQEQADRLSGTTSAPSATASVEAEALPPATGNEPAAPAENQQAALTPSSEGDSIRFLPIIGAPVQAVTPLSRQLGAEARSHGLTIRSAGDASSSYILKGYLSAFSDGPSVTVVYVWDVLDNSGSRLHRIQGQENVPSSAADPWAAVPASVMQQIASKTIDEFSSWRQQRGG